MMPKVWRFLNACLYDTASACACAVFCLGILVFCVFMLLQATENSSLAQRFTSTFSRQLGSHSIEGPPEVYNNKLAFDYKYLVIL